MSDHSVNAPVHRTTKVPKAEFRVYFAVILLVALPIAVLAWVAEALWRRQMPAKDPVTRAWDEARRITPLIFSA